MDMQLDKMLAEGLDARFARHRAMADFVRNWAVSSGFELFAPEGYRSDTLTVIKNNKGLDIGALGKWLLKEKDAQMSNGYGKLKDVTFRIPHMADLTMKDMQDITSWITEGARLQGKL
jgi:aspartate aminotransferase-like enzyme